MQINSPVLRAKPPRATLTQIQSVNRIRVQLRVVQALIIRNIMARYGRENFGYLWIVCEPMVLVGGVVTIWSVVHPNGNHGLPVAAFVLASYVPLTLWRYLSSTPRLLSGNLGLLYHRRITVYDILIARALAEIAGVSAAGIVVYLLLLSTGFADLIAEPSLVLIGLLMMSLFGFGTGCLIAGLSERFPMTEFFVQPVQYFLLPLSGCFYMVSWLPPGVQQYVLAVPLVHIYEMTRAGFYGPSLETHYSVSYVCIWVLVLMASGLWAVSSARSLLSTR
jgi:capsular polysaccharide transport system permease protein